MKKLTSSESLITINHYKNLLASEGIPTQIRNEHLGSIMGEMPFVETWPEIWVINDLDFDRATQLITSVDSESPHALLAVQEVRRGKRGAVCGMLEVQHLRRLNYHLTPILRGPRFGSSSRLTSLGVLPRSHRAPLALASMRRCAAHDA